MKQIIWDVFGVSFENKELMSQKLGEGWEPFSVSDFEEDNTKRVVKMMFMKKARYVDIVEVNKPIIAQVDLKN